MTEEKPGPSVLLPQSNKQNYRQGHESLKSHLIEIIIHPWHLDSRGFLPFHVESLHLSSSKYCLAILQIQLLVTVAGDRPLQYVRAFVNWESWEIGKLILSSNLSGKLWWTCIVRTTQPPKTRRLAPRKYFSCICPISTWPPAALPLQPLYVPLCLTPQISHFFPSHHHVFP